MIDVDIAALEKMYFEIQPKELKEDCYRWLMSEDTKEEFKNMYCMYAVGTVEIPQNMLFGLTVLFTPELPLGTIQLIKIIDGVD